MSEVEETSQQMRQLTMTLLSAALAAAQAGQMLRARKAREALRAAQHEQARAARQLRADRAAAALLWNKALDPRLARDNPEQLAQAWASAAAWESLDSRAAVTVRRLDARLRAAGVHPQTARTTRDSDDYAALSLLLARADQATAPSPPTSTKVAPQRDPAEVISAALDRRLAEEVLAAEALPALMNILDRVQRQGHDPIAMLSRVARQRGFDDAWDPAAILHHRLHNQLVDAEATSADPSDNDHHAAQMAADATRDGTGADHDLADAQRRAEHASAEVAPDPRQDPVTQAAAADAAQEHASAAERLEHDVAALTAWALDTTPATDETAPGVLSGPDGGFTGGSPTARLAAESYPHSLRTALARGAGAAPRLTKPRRRGKGHHPERDFGR